MTDPPNSPHTADTDRPNSPHAAASTTLSGHGGLLILSALQAAGSGIDTMFTLSGGHIFPLLDAAHVLGWKIVDVRHEQTAVFAAEGMAKVTRTPGLAALTAGPGVTNGVSALTGAYLNGSPVLVLGGRAPQHRWGSGSLQELDHIPIVTSVTKFAATATETSEIPGLIQHALREATTAHRGPVFVDFPLDVIGGHAEVELSVGHASEAIEPDPADIAHAAALIASAERPVCIAGGDVYWAHGEKALVDFAVSRRVPVFVNGLGRGTIPGDHELSYSRARPLAKEADVVVVIGTPLDFRLSFGRFGEARVIHVVDHEDRRTTHVESATTIVGDPRLVLEALATAPTPAAADHEAWITRLRDEERARRSAETGELESDSDPIHPARVYGELRKRLDRDGIVIGDGGDFVSYAGRLVDSYAPGCFLEPGPYGCLGTGLGYAIASRIAAPTRQVVVCLGDGAFGFSAMDVDTLVRHDLPVVMIVGNNGIWGLEKHPMQFFYGYDVAADLRQSTRYDDVVKALGGAGETVSSPEEVGPALDRAFAAGVPYLVNVLTNPAIAYPRSSNLA
ncbi:MAG: acetolactate synthase [Acidimicrobiales bacterium]